MPKSTSFKTFKDVQVELKHEEISHHENQMLDLIRQLVKYEKDLERYNDQKNGSLSQLLSKTTKASQKDSLRKLKKLFLQWKSFRDKFKDCPNYSPLVSSKTIKNAKYFLYR